MIKLRPYQLELVDEIREAMRRHKSVLVRLPTGGGKTAIAADLTAKAVAKAGLVYFVCHRQELLHQTARTFKAAGIRNYSFVASGWPYNPRAQVQICSIGSLARRLEKVPPPKLMFIDEAHHTSAAGWAKTKNAFPDAWAIGLSATPQRLDGKGLSSHYSTMIQGPTEGWLMDNGFLSKYRLYVPGNPDVSRVTRSIGDFKTSDLNGVMDKPTITGDIISHWQRLAAGKRTIVFAVSIRHSLHIAEQFRNAGIRAEHLDGTSLKNDRQAAARRFASGETMVMCNVDLFGEGYDLAAQAGMDVTVDCVIQARPTQSIALHRQQVGRALRPKPDGSMAIILDHAGNAYRHGYPDDEIEWSLDGHDGKDKKQEKDIQMRVCPSCFAAHRPMPVCPYCKHEYMAKAKAIEHRDGELEEVTKESARILRIRETAQHKTLDDLIKYGYSKGYKNPAAWAAHVWTARLAKQQQRVIK